MCPFLSAQDIWPDWGLNPGLLGYIPGAVPLNYLAMGDPMWIALYDDRLHLCPGLQVSNTRWTSWPGHWMETNQLED